MAIDRRLFFLVLATASFSATRLYADDILAPQSVDSFFAALHDGSTSPPFVAVTVINDTTGQNITGCIPANLFLGAIHREYGIGYDRLSNEHAITEIILADGTDQAEGLIRRTFHFKQQSAWENMPSYAWKPEACDIIKSGKVARLADRSGAVISADH